ncbi:hypothetical protein BLD44_017630 [Mastigocladus laminosus UU774]|nr:hypothetical protein B4U84_18880 [Westiellopsis prolifica IICB1]TFI53158.1 hypothetical protein BLD44_017630 [Mastigocladus laminosus UU774]
MIDQLSPNQNLWEPIVQDGLRFLIKQWQLGFAEAAHIMSFPREQGFIAAVEEQYGDVFQRALIADVLCDATKLLGEQLQPVIDHEVNYLLNCRRNSGVGGWSYFPNLPELPPDADDLAQIMQVLLRSGRRSEVEKYCKVPLSVLLQNNTHADGSFETWIVPATDRTPEQNLQFWWVQQAWGTGRDPDVMANLLYTLVLYDPELFEQVIQDGVAYLESQQREDGSWQSSWYHGSYYGTYVCLRLLTLVRPGSPGIARAINFLYECQQVDGGWGIEDNSDPLSTALALLSLELAQQDASTEGVSKAIATADIERVLKGCSYLKHCQQEDKSWASCKFIRMELGRAAGRVRAILFYGSQTITTAFILKAALAWSRVERTSSMSF